MDLKMDLKIPDYKNDMEKYATMDLHMKLATVLITKRTHK